MPSIMASNEALQTIVAKARAGDMQIASRLLASQAVSLDAIFTELPGAPGQTSELSRRGGSLHSAGAQAKCRTNSEALAKLHQPREQTVSHVRVNEGGRAVVAEHFHNHTGGNENAKTAKQRRENG